MAAVSNTPRPAYVWDAEGNQWVPVGVGAHSHNEIPKTVVDAKGDLIVGTANDTVDRLAVGANNTKLVADSSQTTGQKWVGFQGASLYQSGAGTQSIATNTLTALTFDSEDWDTDSFHSTSTNTSRITIPTGMGGYYLITVNAFSFAANATGTRGGTIRKNNSDIAYIPDINPVSGSFYPGFSFSTILNLAAGDYIEVFVSQTSGGNLNVYKRSADRPFAVQYLGA